ncbi:MAG TPA: RluA family pseudouridine synthase [Pyrinomonadaceae bacterium]|nr:RluA family pseudouridine synthase [Pyrinomonadaceae bacterium]
MSETQSTITATIDDAGSRLDAFLATQIEGWSRARLQKQIENGDVLVNGKEAKPSYKLREGDEIDIDLTETPAERFEPENIPLDIVFEDEYLAVINKPAGMVVHPGAGINSGTLANAIAWHLSEPPASAGGQKCHDGSPNWPPAHAGGSDRVGLVHRLDKDTSGLILVAKDEQTHEALAEQFRDRTVEKSYVALVHGVPRENKGTIDRPIARDRWHRTKMTVAANGRHALSLWKVRKRFEKFTLVDVDIKTGRTHQIRVHLASINHPVVGDATYNEGRDNTINDSDIKRSVEKLNRFFLHAQRLAFTHPKTGERISLFCELPPELAQLLKLLA